MEGSGGLSGASDLIFGSDGYLYVSSFDTNEVLRFKEAHVSSVANEKSFPGASILSQNYPNPFKTSTTIEYNLPEAGLVSIEVYDVLGRVVDVLKNENQSAGTHQIKWKTNATTPVGLYLLRVTTAAGDQVLPMLKGH